MSRHQKILIIASIVISAASIVFSTFNSKEKDDFSFSQATYQGTIIQWENNILKLKESNATHTIYVIGETQSFVDIYSDATKKTLQKSNPINIQSISEPDLIGKKASIIAVRSKKGTIIASEIHIQEIARTQDQDGEKNVDILFPPPRIPSIPKP